MDRVAPDKAGTTQSAFHRDNQLRAHADSVTAISENDAQRVVEATRLPLGSGITANSIAQALNELRDAATVYRSFLEAPTALQVRQQLDTIRKASWRLAKALGVLNGADMRDSQPALFGLFVTQAQRHAKANGQYPELSPTFMEDECGNQLDYQPAVAVLRAVEGVWRLSRWSDSLEKSPPPPLGDGAEPFERWLIGGQLPPLYERFFGRPFGIVKDQEGPAVRFVNAVLGTLAYNQKPANAIELHWDRWRRDRREETSGSVEP